MIHPKGIVEDGASVGKNTRIWAWAHVLGGATIGENCNVCDHTFIENDVKIGNNVTLKCGVYVWDGLTIEDNVFIGPNVTFTNDKFPRSKQYSDRYSKTVIRKGASIGANATVLPVTVGSNAMIGAGAVVTRDVPPNAIVVGNPAKIVGYVGAKQVEIIDEKSENQTDPRIIHIPSYVDMRGELSVLELEKTLPFPIKRIFYTYKVETNQVRGEHAHKKCEQFLIALAGQLNVIIDDGKRQDEYILDSPKRGVHIPSGCWGIQYKHSSDCVLLVCASHEYESDDYIRNYDDFLRYKGY